MDVQTKHVNECQSGLGRKIGTVTRACPLLFCVGLLMFGAVGTTRAADPAGPSVAPAAAPTDAPTAPPTGAPAAKAYPEDEAHEPYPVTGVEFIYELFDKDGKPVNATEDLLRKLDLPTDAELRQVQVELIVRNKALTATHDGLPNQLRFTAKPIKIAAIGSKPPYDQLYPYAIRRISERLVQYFGERHHGVIGVVVYPKQNDFDGLDDMRDKNKENAADKVTTLRLAISVGRVADVRTVASGDRLGKDEKSVNNLIHRSIIENSPAKKDAGSLRREDLDEYVLQLSRHPGRRVDVALSPATQPGSVVVDYLVSESRPWFVYAQVSNTGTKQTSEWRERFGASNNQVFGKDDIFSIDYTTAGFDKSQSVSAAYDAPLLNLQHTRFRVFGTYNSFTASDVGQQTSTFTGLEYSGGGELIQNLYQNRELFVDAFVGGEYRHIKVDTNSSGTSTRGTADYGEAYGGVRAERYTETSSLSGELRLSYAQTGASQTGEINFLGNVGAKPSFTLLTGDVHGSVFLEPLLDAANFTAGKSTLAHEIYASGRFQDSFGDFLIAQQEQTIGGLYTVRGYPESVVAADSALIGSLEYRFHVPRARHYGQPGKFLGEDFRYAPQRPYGQTDWDLILKGFIDAGHSFPGNGSPQKEQSLVGTGVGVEFRFKQYFALRLDYGVALNRVNVKGGEQVAPGDSRLHVVATFSY